jgi:cytidylate kinase
MTHALDPLDVVKKLRLVTRKGDFAITFVGNLLDDEKLRSEQIARRASEVARIPGVRSQIRSLVRSEISRRACVIEGRDCGSVIASEAGRKFYLTADVIERARRRVHQQSSSTVGLSFESVLRDIVARDEADSRQLAVPQSRSDVVCIDCTWLSVAATVDAMMVGQRC